MAASLDRGVQIFVRRLESVTPLTPEDRDAIHALPVQTQDIKADQEFVREGDRPTRCFILLDGFAATYKLDTPKNLALSARP